MYLQLKMKTFESSIGIEDTVCIKTKGNDINAVVIAVKFTEGETRYDLDLNPFDPSNPIIVYDIRECYL